MAQTNTTKTRDGKKINLYRTHTNNVDLSSTQYLPATQFQIGIDQTTPLETDTSIDNPVPISYGTANDNGANQMTGSLGGDNTTDNTSSFKYGGGASDATSQNLVVNLTSISKVWDIADLTTNGFTLDVTKYGSIWIYIKDQTTLDYLATAGEAIRAGYGTDSSNYYYQTWSATELSTGWNWLTSYGTPINGLSTVGTPASTYNYFRIQITTNNATDAWGAGDVIYDLLHSYDDANLFKDFVTGYPVLDFNTLEATTRLYVTSIEGNGFNTSGVAETNEDSAKLTTGLTQQTEESKSPTDEYAWVIVDRVL